MCRFLQLLPTPDAPRFRANPFAWVDKKIPSTSLSRSDFSIHYSLFDIPYSIFNFHIHYDKYLPTIGIRRPCPKALGETRSMGGV
jgi:hypothetical protein